MSKKGFSLIEVLVFVSILGMFFVIAIAVTISSLRNMKINEHKILATKYGEELLEWFRSQKEKDFQVFATYAGDSGTSYCFNSLRISWPGTGSCSTYNGLNPPIYTRDAILTKSGSPTTTTVSVEITVSWQEIGNTYTVPINSVFYIYE
jgi:prepilin-type N-terminal cleavage/methylation domain-containing protein